MTLTVSTDDVARASGKTHTTVLRWTSDVPKVSEPGARAHRYNIAHILPRLNASQSSTLLGLAQHDAGLWVGGDDMLPAAEGVCSWMEQHPMMLKRLKMVRISFFNALACKIDTGLLVSDTERLRTLLVLSQYVLPFLITGDNSSLPEFSLFAPTFAVMHSSTPREVEFLAAA
ncbi:hypothetical protein [Thioclava sp. GXIMD4215]|uniref:hypothetical protein n=1 Tax=Thioclava sp. GXIMD4215 TaxID=3131928 RepID=UPI0032452EA8